MTARLLWLLGLALLVGACAPRWNSQSRTVTREEFLSAANAQAVESPRIRVWHPWRYGGADRSFYYYEYWMDFSTTGSPTYMHSIRAPREELKGWTPPR